MKRSTKQTIFVSFISVLVVIVITLLAYFLYYKQIQEQYKVELQSAKEEISKNTKVVYTAKQDIKVGDQIQADLLEKESMFTNLPEEIYLTDGDIGKLAVVDIDTGMPIMKNMISGSSVGKDIREEEFDVFYLSSNLQENDFVDIRILYPNGEDYVVLSKKAVKGLSVESNNCFMWLDAEELDRISGATVDCFLHNGTKLYSVKYVEPLIQDASVVNYNPGTDVINLIRNDPNIVKIAQENLSEEIRNGLDDRLNAFYQNYNGEISWNQGTGSTGTGNNNSGGSTLGNEITQAAGDSNNAQENTEEGDLYYVE